ncbi:MAG: beta-N-acetylhexosaminidase [Clostridia bacterium]|nr:beta-N-acetylhexosaminidase [Clostridia bacterium]
MINVIPKPNNLTLKDGDCFIYRKRVLLHVDKELSDIEKFIDKCLCVKTEKAVNESHIEFIYDDTLPEETYSLKSEGYGIKVFAGTYSGAFYGLMTLSQLINSEGNDGETVICPQLMIEKDAPKHSWRGLQLDESRHFFGKETVKKYLDFMALYKLNRFHWHLTDDQGWRIEIEKYPLLTEIGSYRKGSQLHSWSCTEYEEIPHSGYYTKEDIREIIAYAKERCIEIIPEIDFPAHCAAAIAAYNDLACRNIPCEVFDFCGDPLAKVKGIRNWNRPLCLGKDEVIDFAKNVIDEVAELFPFPYFHVGGDEAPQNEWKKCPECQKRIKDKKLKNETELQAWFTNEINAFLKEKGKTMIGWNEVLASKNTDADIIGQYWTPKKDDNVIRHLKKGGKVILSCHKYFYFDMAYDYCTPKGTYSYEPKDSKIKKELNKGILGIEAEMWTEWITNEDHIFFMLFNRGLALSENAWTYNKNYSNFKSRLQLHKAFMDKMGIYYGNDHITMYKNKSYKKSQSKKYGFTVKHNDAEFRLDGIYNKEMKKQAKLRAKEKAEREEAEKNAKGIDELIDSAVLKIAEKIMKK